MGPEANKQSTQLLQSSLMFVVWKDWSNLGKVREGKQELNVHVESYLLFNICLPSWRKMESSSSPMRCRQGWAGQERRGHASMWTWCQTSLWARRELQAGCLCRWWHGSADQDRKGRANVQPSFPLTTQEVNLWWPQRIFLVKVHPRINRYRKWLGNT